MTTKKEEGTTWQQLGGRRGKNKREGGRRMGDERNKE